jgi:hypothetical protein
LKSHGYSKKELEELIEIRLQYAQQSKRYIEYLETDDESNECDYFNDEKDVVNNNHESTLKFMEKELITVKDIIQQLFTKISALESAVKQLSKKSDSDDALK